MDIVLTVVQYIGIAAFSISGTIVAIKKRTDVLGALIFALLTSFGGGLIRDLILDRPISLLGVEEYRYMALVCIGVSLLCFHLVFIGRTAEFIRRHEHDFWLELADAVGLAVFCVLGVDVAISAGGTENNLLLIFSGCITGVGGGILRDICSAEIPTIFRKHVYFIPAIGGTMLYVFSCGALPHLASMLISIAVIILVRMLAHTFKWNLPVPGKAGKIAAESEVVPK